MERNSLNLSGLKKLLQVFSNKDSDCILMEDNLTINGIHGKYYSIHLYGNYLCCKCSDGRIIEAELEKKRNDNDNLVLKYKYNFDKNSSISNNISIFRGNSNNFSDDINLLNNAKLSLLRNLNIEYDNDSKFYISYECRFEDYYSFNFTEDGIIFSDSYTRFLMSSDLNKVISLNNKKAPSVLECKSFNSQIEFEKIKRILNENKEALHPFIIDDIDFIKEALNKLYSSNSTVADFCDRNLSICKNELEKYNSLIQNLNKRVFFEEEIAKFIEIISIAVDKYKSENKSLRKVLK